MWTLIDQVYFQSVTDSDKFVFQTPLHLAVITKQVGIVTSLLMAYASPNLPDRKGHTAVHLAIQHNAPQCLEALLTRSKFKVDLDIKNYDGEISLTLKWAKPIFILVS